jgi:hypothetical protein
MNMPDLFKAGAEDDGDRLPSPEPVNDQSEIRD